MKDLRGKLDKLRADAQHCALMSMSATNPEKRELFGRLADQLAVEALELEQVVKRRTAHGFQRSLHLVDRNDPIAEIVAKTRDGARGVREPSEISKLAVRRRAITAPERRIKRIHHVGAPVSGRGCRYEMLFGKLGLAWLIADGAAIQYKIRNGSAPEGLEKIR